MAMTQKKLKEKIEKKEAQKIFLDVDIDILVNKEFSLIADIHYIRTKIKNKNEKIQKLDVEIEKLKEELEDG